MISYKNNTEKSKVETTYRSLKKIINSIDDHEEKIKTILQVLYTQGLLDGAKDILSANFNEIGM